MKILDIGHQYELANFDQPDKSGQILQFIKKTPIKKGLPELKVVNDGTTNEEVLLVLIDRLNTLNTIFPSQENTIALIHIETALLWLDKRTADRIARGVEGTCQK